MIEVVRRPAPMSCLPRRRGLISEGVLGPTPSAPPTRVSLGDDRLQRLLVPSEPGLDIPAFLLRPAGEVRAVLVALDDRGKEVLASDPVVERAHARGWAVCGVDPRGIGESATDKTGWVFAVSLLLGENFVGRQAWDLGRVLEVLRSARRVSRQARRPLCPGRERLPRGHVCDRPDVRRRKGPIAMVSPPRRVPELPVRSSIGRSLCPRPIDSCPKTGTGPPHSTASPRDVLRLRRPPVVRPAPAPRHVRGHGSDRQPPRRGPGTSPGGDRPRHPPTERPDRLRGRARAKGRGVSP